VAGKDSSVTFFKQKVVAEAATLLLLSDGVVETLQLFVESIIRG
jgi:hypothetical protein